MKQWIKEGEIILLVDDDQELLEIIQGQLEKWGLPVVCATNVAKAKEQIAANTIAMAVLDYRLPDGNGLDVARQIRQTSEDIPVVMVTAFADRDLVMAAMRENLSDIIDKPFQTDVLREKIEQWLKTAHEKRVQEDKWVQELAECFIEEADQLLEGVDNLILSLEERATFNDSILTLFRKIHTIKGGAGSIPLGKGLASLAHTFETSLACFKDQNTPPSSVAIDLYLEALDLMHQLLGEMKRGQKESDELQQRVSDLTRRLDSKQKEAALGAETNQAFDEAKKPAAQKAEDGIYVYNKNLDSLMGLCGETVVFKNMFQGFLNSSELKPEERRQAHDLYRVLGKISERLQSQIMEVRKVKLEKVCAKLPRIVRQAAGQLGKQVKFHLEGGDLGVDKSLANALTNSLTHIVRNSCDHGIETREDRLGAGKEEHGRIDILAQERDGRVMIEIKDDGKGLDRDKIVAHALAKGMIDRKKVEELSGSQVFQLIFESGLSTASEVSDISGRGVGMDVVRSEIAQLGGQVEVQSTPGEGSRFTLNIPAPRTVMVEESIIARTEDLFLAIPLTGISSIDVMSDVKTSQVASLRGCHYRGQTVPLARYGHFLGAPDPGQYRDDQTVIFIQHEERFVGIVVDEVIAQMESVIRPFGRNLPEIPGFLGTSNISEQGIAFVLGPGPFVAQAFKNRGKEVEQLRGPYLQEAS